MIVTWVLLASAMHRIMSLLLIPLRNVSSLLISAVRMAKLTPVSHGSSFPLPFQTNVYAHPVSIRSPVSASMLSLRAFFFMLYHDNSWPTIAIMPSGLLMFLVSISVQIFHAAICIAFCAFLPVFILILFLMV